MYNAFINKFNKFLFNKKIFSEISIDKFEQLSRSIPEEFAYFLYGYEIILNSEENNFDFFCGLSYIGQDSNKFIFNLRDKFYENQTLVAADFDFKKLLCYWSDANYRKEMHLENIWLEYDLSKEQFKGKPALFFGREIYKNNKFDSNENKEILCSFFNYIKLITSLNFNESNLADLILSTGYVSKFSDIGFMLNRNIHNPRILFYNMSESEIIDFFSKFNNINQNKLKKFFNDYRAYFDTYALQLEVCDEKFSDNVSIEGYQKYRPIKFSKQLAEYTFTKMEQMNICHPNKKRELINFISKNEVINSPSIMLDNSVYTPTHLKQHIHHYKFTFSGDSILAKIYLCSEFDWKKENID